jgi:hypothetical protein
MNDHLQPAVPEPLRLGSLVMLLVASIPASLLTAFPVAAIYAFLFSLPVPVGGGSAIGFEGIRASPYFVLLGVFLFGWPLLVIIGMGVCAAVATFFSRVRSQGAVMLATIAIMELVALAIAVAIWFP